VLLDWDRYLGRDGTVSVSFLRCASRESLADFIRGKAPPGRELAIGRVGTAKSEPMYRTFLLHEKPVLTGDNVVDARVKFEQDNPYKEVTFNAEGAALFAKFTAENVKKRIAIVLDGMVDSAPIIKSAIPGGICSIHLGARGGPSTKDCRKPGTSRLCSNPVHCPRGSGSSRCDTFLQRVALQGHQLADRWDTQAGMSACRSSSNSARPVRQGRAPPMCSPPGAAFTLRASRAEHQR
jgi:hypothetical protein